MDILATVMGTKVCCHEVKSLKLNQNFKLQIAYLVLSVWF